MSGKEQILARIREALRNPAPIPGHHGDGRHTGDESEKGGHADHAAGCGEHASHASGGFSQWLPPVGSDLESQLELFAKNSADLRTEFHRLSDLTELPARLCELARESRWQRVATHGGKLTGPAASALGLPTLHTDGGYAVEELERCDVGITECEALVAQTGSVLITARSAGGRALSVLPPHHVVVATRAQMVPDLPAAYALLRRNYGTDFPSFMSFITGPSRTGDIERILVLGAHGPKRLTVFCG